MNPLDATRVTLEIERLLAEYPELAEDEALRADMVEGSTDAFAVLSRIVATMREATATVAAIKIQADALLSRAERFERREKAMRALAQRIMEAANIRKAELPEATLSIRAVAPRPVVTDEAALPEEAWRTKREHNLKWIADQFRAGEFVPGAEMSNGGATLSVRV